MKLLHRLGSALGLIGLLALGACADTNDRRQYRDYPDSGYAEYGVVQRIELVDQRGGGVGLGTVAGAVAGGLVGSQIGGGSGKTAATVLGAAGGAYVGHELENRDRPSADAYRVTVRMDNGSSRTFTQGIDSRLRVGERVRVRDGVLHRY